MDNNKKIRLVRKASRSTIILIFLLVMMNGFMPRAIKAAEPIRFYVSTSGNDSNKGTINEPFANLQAAQIAVRNIRQSGIETAIEVIIRGGIYYLDETLEFKPEDSGTKDAPVTWRAAES